jgi:glutamate carboxypeptidase
MRKVLNALAILFCCPVFAKAQGLSEPERRMVASVDNGHPAAITLLERLVNINSGTHNFAGVRAVADALAPEFQRLGFTTRWSDGSSWNRAGHLWQSGRGTEMEGSCC